MAVMKPLEQTRSLSLRLGCCGSRPSSSTDRVGVEDLEVLARIGFDYIELSLADVAALPPPAFRSLKQHLRGGGIPCEACNHFFPECVRLTGSGARLAAALEYAVAAMERAASLGVRIIVFGSSGARNVPPGFSKDIAWKQIVELLQHLGPIAAQHGITISIEPMSRRESNIINRAAEGLLLVREVNHPNIQLLIDYYHLMLEKENPDIILTAGPALRHVHFAEVAGRVFPTEEKKDYALFFDSLRQAGYEGRCSLEGYTCDFAAEASRAFALLTRLAKGRSH
jgi:sugar phosphate isomerase/epimerase